MVYAKQGRRLAWIIIEDVPGNVKRAQVAQALEDSGADHKYSPGTGRIFIQPEEKWGELDGCDQANRLVWSTMIPEKKALVLRSSGAEHARLSRAARRLGTDLHSWALTILIAAADEILEPASAPPPASGPGHGGPKTTVAPPSPATPVVSGGPPPPLKERVGR